MTSAKRRPRRIAADEAHAWARNLKLRNPYAKLLLCMLAGYVDGDGVCFVSVPALAEDTELSANTIRDRMAWLEDIGVIAQSAQWIDERGHRNSEGRGRRTSNNIRLMVDLSEENIEDRAAAKGRRSDPPPREGSGSDADPPSREGSAGEGDSSGTPIGLQRPPNCAVGLISEPEPEPEESPQPPLAGGLRDDQSDLVISEPEHFAEFWRGYPGHRVMSRQRALEVFVTMTTSDQLHARAAVAPLTADLDHMKRRPKDAHKWLAERGWMEFPQTKIPHASAVPLRRMIKHAELAAVAVALKISNLRPLSTISTASEETGRQTDAGFWSRPIGPDLQALAPFAKATDVESQWHFVEDGGPQFAAWRDRLQHWTGCPPEPVRKWLEDYNPQVHGLPGSHPDFKIRKFARGLRVPTPWPPRRDGSWPSESEGEA